MPPFAPAATTVVGVDGSGRSHRLAQLAATFPGPVLDLPGRDEPAAAWTDRLAAATRDTLLVVDDAHRCPGPILLVLAATARRGVPALVARRPTIDRPELAELDEAVGGGTVLLEPLDVAGVAGLLGRITGRSVPPAEALRVHTAGGGRPALVAAMAGAREDGERLRPAPALTARVQRHLARCPAEITALARVLALCLDLTDRVLATAAGLPLAELPALIRELSDSGWLTETGESMLPAVATAIRREASPSGCRRVHEAVAAALLAWAPESLVLAAGQLRAGQARGSAAAAVYRRAGESLRFARPSEALNWFDEAAASGAEPGGLAAGRAEAAAMLGLPHSPAAASDGRSSLAAGAVAAHEGRAGRAAETLLAAGAPGPVLAVPMLIAVGCPDQAREAVREPAPDPLARLAEAALAIGAPDRALPLFIEAAEAVERTPPAVVLPDTPHALGALVAMAVGDPVTAAALLRRALATTVGGPVAVHRHRLLLSWARLRAGREGTAGGELAALSGVTLLGREALLRAALGAGLARRDGDLAGMRRYWAEAEPMLARDAIDLWQIDALEEVLITAARLREPRRIEPVLARLDRIVAALGAPPVWLARIQRIRARVVIAGEDTEPTGPLSSREQAVARLVLAGRTHREIGAQLYISAKTVEHHVARIRVKLGANTRSELITALHRALGDRPIP
ncbi:LuxR C-terminal-related transcriptional regulator [Actinoplanes sp. G11-F43]|uniref:helix-turn-helix transcriptional regulator n=1 Tax=Actinoplanes sp. G11-F43 TaxID=3424130 RepID=UPI003D337471